MVGSSAHNMEWQSNPITNPRPCSGNGRIPSGLGCSFRGSAYRGSVVGEGAYTTHQLLGVDGRCIGSENICKAQKEYPCTITNGQQNGNLLHKPYGGNPIPEYGAVSLSAMVVVSTEGDNSFSRVFTRGKERDSRRRITNHAIFSRMDAECSSVQMHNAGMGPCQIDLFATCLNHQLDHYVSWRPDPFAMATDAFQITWRNYQGYAFPPFALVGKCLQKIHQEESTVVLVAPVWKTQWWYPYLLQLLIDYPLLLPVHPDLLSNPFKRKHPLLL